jgi:hypothetical protein
MGKKVTIEEFLRNVEEYCERWNQTLITTDDIKSIAKDCDTALAILLKKYGADVFFTEEPVAHVAAIINDVFVAFAEVTCADNEFYVSQLWCWKRRD